MTEPTLYNPRERRIYGLLKHNEEGLTLKMLMKMLPRHTQYQINASLLQMERRRILVSRETEHPDWLGHDDDYESEEVHIIKVYSIR